jgi:hypothetical protein
MSGSLVGEWLQVINGKIAFDFSWIGNPTGTFSFQVANDPAFPYALPGSFTPSLGAPAGAAGSAAADVIETQMAQIRPLFTRTGGTGVLTGRATGGI